MASMLSSIPPRTDCSAARSCGAHGGAAAAGEEAGAAITGPWRRGWPHRAATSRATSSVFLAAALRVASAAGARPRRDPIQPVRRSRALAPPGDVSRVLVGGDTGLLRGQLFIPRFAGRRRPHCEVAVPLENRPQKSYRLVRAVCQPLCPGEVADRGIDVAWSIRNAAFCRLLAQACGVT